MHGHRRRCRGWVPLHAVLKVYDNMKKVGRGFGCLLLPLLLLLVLVVGLRSRVLL
jgi:hypothetical protein